MMPICINEKDHHGSDNDLLPVRYQSIASTNDDSCKRDIQEQTSEVFQENGANFGLKKTQQNLLQDMCHLVLTSFCKLCIVHCVTINSLAPGTSQCDSKNVIFNLVLLIGIFRSSHDNALWWMPQDLTDDQSTLVQVMAWCHQATSHYLSQCWPRSLSPYGVTRPQWVNINNSFDAFSAPKHYL